MALKLHKKQLDRLFPQVNTVSEMLQEQNMLRKLLGALEH